jgi:hypothetical protein
MVKNHTAQKGVGESKPANGAGEQGMLETTAQAIGSTLGNLAVKTGIAKPPAAESHAKAEGEAKPNGNVVSLAGHKPGGKHARRSKKKNQR